MNETEKTITRMANAVFILGILILFILIGAKSYQETPNIGEVNNMKELERRLKSLCKKKKGNKDVVLMYDYEGEEWSLVLGYGEELDFYEMDTDVYGKSISECIKAMENVLRERK